jgi:fibronectin type 3 domain-containing protein
MDGTHRPVICALWPKNALQAPAREAPGAVPQWTDGGSGLDAAMKDVRVVLNWRKATGAEYYDVYRSDDGGGGPQLMDAVKATLWTDGSVLGGRTYRYTVRARDASGRGGPASETVSIQTPQPDYMAR